MLKMKRRILPRSWCCALALVLGLGAQQALAQDGPQGTSRGENFSAKPPAQLFASDCTGAGCHKSPQGLGKSVGIGGLAGFLREHYTNSRESAAALANYLSKIPAGPEPKEARTPRSGGKPATASAPGSPGWFDGGSSESKPASTETRPQRQPPAGQNAAVPNAATPGPTGRASRATVKPDEDLPAAAATSPTADPSDAKPSDAAAKPSAEPGAKPADSAAKPAEGKPVPPSRAQRVRQPATATAAAPSPPHVPEAAPAPAPVPASPPAPPAPKQFDIFD